MITRPVLETSDIYLDQQETPFSRWKLGLLGTKRATDIIWGTGNRNYAEIITNPKACYKPRKKKVWQYSNLEVYKREGRQNMIRLSGFCYHNLYTVNKV